ncbi:ATPase [Chitinophaga caeni]|uniref:ATPase n=1 Tax=Chitinophaga caeni TaxID=2029983 RepID=A0A291R183_9BACT|nr:ATPase [Chitinophaga caeni]ATL49960.1 ATPase [Chitinophaga caeni]
MEKLQFNVRINAKPATVWAKLWTPGSYEDWTKAFSESSRAETDWQKGSKILFLDGDNNGMVSRVADMIPDQWMSIEHLGLVSKGVEDTESPEIKAWAGAKENYALKEVDHQTDLQVEVDVNDDFSSFLSEKFPKALARLKEISEA